MAGKRGGALAAPIWERFWSKVERGQHHWIWTGALNDSGYGVIWDGRQLVYAHRLSWLMVGGYAIPDGLTIDHMCFEKRCVNPVHLEPVPRRENMDRAVRHRADWGYTITDETRERMREAQRRRRDREKAA